MTIDTVAWGGPIQHTATRPGLPTLDRRREADYLTGEVLRDALIFRLPSGVTLTLTSRNNGERFARAEASLPKVAFGSNVQGLAVPEALRLLAELDDEVGQFVTWPLPPDCRRLLRVDAVRDFQSVDRAPHLVRRLATSTGYQGRSQLWNDPMRLGALTLARGSKSRRGCLYDKHQEVLRAKGGRGRSGGSAGDIAASFGRLRYELRLRSTALAALDMATVGRFREQTVSVEARKQFLRLGFGMEVVGLHGLVARLVDSDLSPVKRSTLIGFLVQEAAGVEDTGLSHNTKDEYRRLARRLGLSLGSEAVDDVPVRLDYDVGRAVSSLSSAG